MSTILIIGGAGGLGRGLAEEHLKRGWDVIATVRRDDERWEAEALAIELLDTTDWSAVDTFGERLTVSLDRLYVVAGVGGPDDSIGEVDPDEFCQTLLVNTLAPLRIVDRLADQVTEQGTIAVMTSSQGSGALDDKAGNEQTGGGSEAYRISKAGLNLGLRTICVRRGDARTYLAINPGWVRTAIGSDQAAMSVQESVSQVVDVLEAREGTGGSQYVDYDNSDIPW